MGLDSSCCSCTAFACTPALVWYGCELLAGSAGTTAVALAAAAAASAAAASAAAAAATAAAAAAAPFVEEGRRLAHRSFEAAAAAAALALAAAVAALAAAELMFAGCAWRLSQAIWVILK